MTVASETATTAIFTGTGLVDTYAYGFLISAEGDLTVKVLDTDDTESTLTLNTDYTLTGVGEAAGGNVVLSASLTLSYKLVAYRAMDYTQEIDLTNQEAIFLTSLETGLDNVTMMIQQLSAKTDLGIYKSETDDSDVPTYTEIAGYATAAGVSAAAALVSQNAAAASAASVVQSWKAPVACRSIGNITLSAEQTLDGILTAVSRVLVPAQTDASENGVYISGPAAWTRALDFDSAADINGAIVPVSGGTLYHGTIWMQESAVVTVDTDSITFDRKDNGDVAVADIDIDGATDIGADISGSDLLMVNNTKSSASRILDFAKAVDFSSKNLIIDVETTATVSLTASFINLINSANRVKQIADVDVTFDKATDLNAGAWKASHCYGLWIDEDETLKFLPDITGTADGTAAGFLVWTGGTAFTDLVKAGDIVYNTTDNTQTTVSVTPTVDGDNIAVTDDIFVDTETFKIKMLTPTGMGNYPVRVGAAFNNAAGNFDDSTYTQIQEEKFYSEAGGDFTLTGTSWTTLFARMKIEQVNDWTGAGSWVMGFRSSGDIAALTSANFLMTLTGILFESTANYYQAVTVSTTSMTGLAAEEYFDGKTNPNAATFLVERPKSSNNAFTWQFSGDFDLDKKPTFHK